MAIKDLLTTEKIIGQFLLDGQPVSCTPFGNGHINSTYVVSTTTNKKYILQEINTAIFTDPISLMSNITKVSQQLKKVNEFDNCLEVIKTKSGDSFFLESAAKKAWRILNYFDDHYVYDTAPNAELAYEGARMFGKFTADLSHLSPDEIHEIIPGFHNMSLRLQLLKTATKKASSSRLNQSKALLDFVNKHSHIMCTLDNLFANNELQLRVTHNDTKFNNVLFDANQKGLCVIDLDTVMPGYLHYDFGDGIRTAVCTADEDEKDLSKITFDLIKLEAYTKGYLESVRNIMTTSEKETLALSVAIMPFIMGVRFLTDFLNNDTYYKIKYPEHNLDRAKAQLHLSNEGLMMQTQIHDFIND